MMKTLVITELNAKDASKVCRVNQGLITDMSRRTDNIMSTVNNIVSTLGNVQNEVSVIYYDVGGLYPGTLYDDIYHIYYGSHPGGVYDLTDDHDPFVTRKLGSLYNTALYGYLNTYADQDLAANLISFPTTFETPTQTVIYQVLKEINRASGLPIGNIVHGYADVIRSFLQL